MFGGVGSCFRAACCGQGTLESSKRFLHKLGLPLGIRCLMEFLKAGAQLWQSGGLEVWLVLPTGFCFLTSGLNPSGSGRPRGGWGRFIAATDLARFSFSRTESGLSWLGETGDSNLSESSTFVAPSGTRKQG